MNQEELIKEVKINANFHLTLCSRQSTHNVHGLLSLPTCSSHSWGSRDRLVILTIWESTPVWYQELFLLSLAAAVLRKPLFSRLSDGL